MSGPQPATATVPELAAQAAALARRLPDVAAVWGAGRLDPKLREEVMLAVAHANACRWCTLAHRQWALSEGLTEAELAALEDQRPEAFDRPAWAAVAWAQARAHADLGPVDAELERELVRHYDAQQRADLDLVTRAMTFANRSANTFDALLARLRGRPVPDSRWIDEVVVGTGVALSIPPVAGYLALVRRRPPLQLVGELRSLSSRSAGSNPSARAARRARPASSASARIATQVTRATRRGSVAIAPPSSTRR